MTEVRTIPDVWYTVTTENGCTIYRADEEKVLKEIEPGQGFFRAVENKVFCSDPGAIFRPFENAPRLRLALLQGGAGGWLPKGYTALEYLESPSTTEYNVAAYFSLPISARNGVDSLRVVSEHFVPAGQQAVQMEGIGVNFGTFSTFAYSLNSQRFFISFDGVIEEGNYGHGDINCFYVCPQGEWVVYDSRRTPDGCSLRLNGELVVDYPAEKWYDYTILKMGCFGRVSGEDSYKPYGLAGRKKWWKLYLNDVLLYDLIPVLDETGAPGFYDRKNKNMYYNAGAGDFLYPEPVSTYSLRRISPYVPEFAMLTPRGVRRLYRTPVGYAGSITEYAAEHGFKRLVESAQPAEGYWSPVWRETLEELRLEWQEMPEPQEEFLTE